MICKICNAAIEDTAVSCPFCGAPVTVDADPGMSSAFPDPAASTVNLKKPSAEQKPDSGESSKQSPYNQPQQSPYNQSQQDPYNQSQQNTYSQSQQNYTYSQYNSYDTGNSELEQQADNLWILGLVAMIASIVLGFCCCCLPGPIAGIVGLVKINNLKDSLNLLSAEKQKKVDMAKLFCVLSLVFGALTLLATAVLVLIAIITGWAEENL